MISVFYGRADRDTDPFVYGRIAERMPQDTILLVPEQFTLQAERDAFAYLNADALLDLEIMSRAGFSRRVLSHAGKPRGIAVNKYGRFMLLSVLADGMDQKDGPFSAVAGDRSFLELLTDLITEMKQYGILPEDLKEIETELREDDLLCGKLEQVREVYEAYQRALEGKYTDTEDLQQYVNEKLREYPRTRSAVFWIYGFDYLSPEMLRMIQSLSSVASEVNIVLTGDDTDESLFEVTRRMRFLLRRMAEEAAVGYREERIEETAPEPDPEIRVIKAGDFYAEAESVAVRVTELIREKGYRYQDIVILCNDMKKRGSVFRRVFESYGIPLFMDDRRSIASEPEVEFILAMIDCVARNRQFDDVFRMLRTGFSPLEDRACDRLEIYCRKYKIRRGRWKTPFKYGAKEEGEDGLAEINGYRETVDAFITDAENLFRNRSTVREKTEALYTFLTERARMPQRILEARRALEEQGLLEQAESTGQMWETVARLFDQIVEVLGEYELTDDAYAEILQEGFREVTIGLIPTAGDQVLLGTMQRTRFSPVKALFVMGANEGVLPEEGHADGLLTDEEKQLIEQCYRSIGRTDELRTLEQELAIFRNLGKAQEWLVLSFSDQDTEGAELRPSELVRELLAAHGDGILRYDALRAGDTLRLVQNRKGAMPHLIDSLRESLDGREPEDVWKAAALALTGTGAFEMAQRGLFFNSGTERTDRERVQALFGRKGTDGLIFSATSLEKYSRCPFSFFVSYGLRPSEERRFEVDLRSVGDIYHDCLRRVAQTLTERGKELYGAGSRWNTVTEEEVAEMTAKYIDEFASSYREGLLQASERELYLRERIKAAAAKTAWMMVLQVRSGTVRGIYFEQSFGEKPYDLFPPIVIRLDDGSRVTVEGKIDRVDILDGGEPEDSLVRIIDYKTGSERFNLDEVRSGWRMQLMIYLKGAMGGVRMAKPAGVFYFSVRSGNVDITEADADAAEGKIQEEQMSRARLDGIMVAEENVIYGMDRVFEKRSSVIPVTRKKDGTLQGKALLSDEEFADLIDVNDQNMRNSAEGLAGGRVDADPAKGSGSDACTYCSYRSICNIL